MDNSTNITIIIHFNGSVIINTEYGENFMFDELTYFLVPQTMLFEELNIGLCQDINISIPKKVVRIRYRCPISNLNNNIQFRAVKISNDMYMQIMFRTYR